MKSNSTISLIFPCYNEVNNFRKGIIEQIQELTQKDKRFTEVIIVDDGSSDASRDIIREYIKTFPQLKLIENNHQGKAFALITGMKAATSDYVMFSDIDLATPLSETPKLLKGAEEGYKIVIGSRSTRRAGAPLLRKIMSAAYIHLRSLFINIQNVQDTQCGFKLFDRESAITIIDRLKVFKRKRKAKGAVVSAGFDVEFLFVGTKLGYTIKEVPVIWHHVDTENVLYFVQDGLRTLKDMLLIKYYDLTSQYNV